MTRMDGDGRRRMHSPRALGPELGLRMQGCDFL